MIDVPFGRNFLKISKTDLHPCLPILKSCQMDQGNNNNFNGCLTLLVKDIYVAKTVITATLLPQVY